MQTISSKENSLVKHLLKLKNKHTYRYAQRKVLIEGKKLIKEISQSLPILRLIVKEGLSIEPIAAQETHYLSSSLLKKLSHLCHPEGVLAEVSMPTFPTQPTGEKILVLDGLQDPGNLGTLLRTALALNWDHVVLLENTVDPFNDKALRAAKGATFHLPHTRLSWQLFTQWCHDNAVTVFLADIKGETTPLTTSSPIALILSREGCGLTRTFTNQHTISIPINQKMDSLNVATAGALLMYTLNSSCQQGETAYE